MKGSMVRKILFGTNPDRRDLDVVHVITIELTERNLRALLAKLERPDSARTLGIMDVDGNRYWVKAVPDEDHYSDRLPGPVHPKDLTPGDGATTFPNVVG